VEPLTGAEYMYGAGGSNGLSGGGMVGLSYVKYSIVAVSAGASEGLAVYGSFRGHAHKGL